jgi:hypothetical protein
MVLSACSLAVDPPPQGTPIELKLDFCANDTPIWFAIQDVGEPFEVITPDASGTFTFESRGRVTVAYVRQRGNDYRTDILYTTNLALEPLATLTCLEQGGSKQVNGTVNGLTGGQFGNVSMSASSAIVPPGQSAWSLSQLVDRPLDVVASRMDSANGSQHANKTIIRNAQNPANGSTIAALDFNTEGIAPAQSTVNISGVGITDRGSLSNTVVTAMGTSHLITFVDSVVDGPVPVETVTSALLATDYHKMALLATATGAVRTTERYFRSLGTQGLVLGPPLIEPSVSLVGATPYVRLRTQVLGQVDYSTMVNTLYHQQTPSQAIDVSMSVTASYFAGTPVEWNLPTPNFDGLPGWQNAWGLKTGAIAWRVTSYFGRPQVVFGAPPNLTDGETVFSGSRFANVTVTGASVQAVRAEANGPTRPGHFGPLGAVRLR